MKASKIFVDITKMTGLYNIQSIDNIPSIIEKGILSYEMAQNIQHTSIAMDEVQKIRESKDIPDGLKLHQYANIYFTYRNPMLSARRSENENLCILKVHPSILDLEGVVVSDRNASSTYAAFYTPEIGMRKIDFNLVYAKSWVDDDKYEYLKKKSIKCAEVLVPDYISYEYISCAAVFSESAKQKLIDKGFDKTIHVMPSIFF